MSNSLKIWLTAILYQTIIFAFTLDMVKEESGVLLFLLPIEVLGGLPGLLVFGIALRQIYRSRMEPGYKWLLTIGAAILAATGTTILTAFVFDISLRSLFHTDFALVYPAPLAALAALLTFSPSLNKYLHENAIEKHS